MDSAVLAQIQTPTGQQIAPGRDELNRTTQQPAPGPSRLTIDGDIERAPCALDAPAYANIKVTITEAQFSNLQGVSAEELKASYASLLGADRPIATICTIRDAAATALRRKGYLATVQVPVQRIENGVVKFQVLFAKIVAVRVRGDAGPAEKLLAGYLSHLTEDAVFNRYNAERYLILARDVPGFDVRLALKPAGGAPGELVGEVSVTRTPVEVNYSLQNFSARSSGRWNGTLQGAAYGLLGGDRLTASVSSTADFKEQRLVQLGYDTRIGSEGLALSGNFTYAWSKPDIGGAIALRARTLFATGETRYPFIRTQAFSLSGAAGLDYLNQVVTFNGQDLTRDRLRVGYLRLDFDAADIAERRFPTWRASGSVEFRQGLDIFGASPPVPTVRPLPAGYTPPARLDGDKTSRLVRASASLEYALGKGYWIAATPRAQYAFDPLFSFEEFSGGNFSIGRGYDPGTVIGDSGLGSGFELRFPRVQPFQKVNLNVLPYVFTDVALTWNKQLGPDDLDALYSVGGGLRAIWNNRFRIDGTVAVPLRKAGFQTKNKDPRFLISVTTQLWPWERR